MIKFEKNVYQLAKLFVAGAVTSIMIAPLPALSQSVLEEVVVTARKHEVSLQDAPIAVSVLSRR